MSVETSDFQTAIAMTVGGSNDARQQVAAAVLASPEMQAIKAHLAQQAEYGDDDYYGAEWLRRVAKLPQSVIEWVLS